MRTIAALLALGLIAGAAGAQIFRSRRGEPELRATLAAWSAGDAERALADLRALDLGDGDATADVHRTKLHLLRALARHQPLALLAGARLEQSAYLTYARERHAAAALDARLLVVELLQEYTRTPRADRLTAAALLAELGSELQANWQEAGAEDLFRQSLALDARQRAARLGLAALLEKRGSYVPAAALLVDFPPDDREARLRLALDLQRTGHAGDAERELRALAGEGADWVRSLAAQELAKVLLARGDGAAALAVLRDAEALLPCDPSLPVVASFVAERASAAGEETQPLDLSALGTCGEAAESARTRYTRPPLGERAALAAQLARAEPSWREALRAALGGTTS